MKLFFPTGNSSGRFFNLDVTPDELIPKGKVMGLTPTKFHLGNPYRRVYRTKDDRYVITYLGKLYHAYLEQEE